MTFELDKCSCTVPLHHISYVVPMMLIKGKVFNFCSCTINFEVHKINECKQRRKNILHPVLYYCVLFIGRT